MDYVSSLAPTQNLPSKSWKTQLAELFLSIPQNLLSFFNKVKTIGVATGLSRYEKSKLCIFNLLNFFQFITGVTVPVLGILYERKIPFGAWLIACLPALVSLFVLILNHVRKYETAVLAYFIFLPGLYLSWLYKWNKSWNRTFFSAVWAAIRFLYTGYRIYDIFNLLFYGQLFRFGRIIERLCLQA